MITLTDEQLVKVQAHQLDSENLPEYFSISSNRYTPISRDFESFLILSKDELKTAAINWIKQAVNYNKTNKLRDDLVALSVAQELENAQLKLKAFNLKIKNFQNFRKEFQTDSNFGSIPEVQLFLRDLQIVRGELISNMNRATFDQTVSQVMQNFDGRTSISNEEIEELSSWTSVLSTYLGS